MTWLPDPTALHSFIQSALLEDVGDGDHTSLSTIPASAQGKAQLLVKDHGILAGVDLAELIFKAVDPTLVMERIMSDGQPMKPGDVAFRVSGPDRSIPLPNRTLPMDTSTLLLAILTATLAGVTFQAWRLGNEKCDVALLGVFSGLLGVGTVVTTIV